MRWVAIILMCGCGRYGFAELALDSSSGDAPHARPSDDAGVNASDGAPAIDSPPGVGDYTVAQSSAPYVALAGTTVPGFTMTADDENLALQLPFTFVFYGVSYDLVTINVNGYLGFGTPVGAVDARENDCPLDATTPDAMIAVFWDDLAAPTVAPLASMTYAFTGSAPDRQLTVEWANLDAYYAAGNGQNSFLQGLRVTHQVTIHENGVIEMHYGPRTAPTTSKDCGSQRHRGCSATIGLEAPASTMYKNVQCGTAAGPGPGYVPIDEGHVITFTPN